MNPVESRYQENRDVIRERSKENMTILFGSEFAQAFEYRKTEQIVLFREKEKPVVNFYPAGNYWVVNNRKQHGTAKDFLEWYRKQ